jgi:hypothetical protein
VTQNILDLSACFKNDYNPINASKARTTKGGRHE